MGSLKAARDLIVPHWRTETLALHASAYLAYENEPKKATAPSPAAAWYRLGIQPLRAQHPGIGAARLLRDRARVVVEIFTPPGEGEGLFYTLEAEQRGIFAGLSLSGVRFSDREDEAPYPVIVGLVDDLGVWWKGLVIAPFRYDYTL